MAIVSCERPGIVARLPVAILTQAVPPTYPN
jgi:hypothetical protein